MVKSPKSKVRVKRKDCLALLGFHGLVGVEQWVVGLKVGKERFKNKNVRVFPTNG